MAAQEYQPGGPKSPSISDGDHWLGPRRLLLSLQNNVDNRGREDRHVRVSTCTFRSCKVWRCARSPRGQGTHAINFPWRRPLFFTCYSYCPACMSDHSLSKDRISIVRKSSLKSRHPLIFNSSETFTSAEIYPFRR